MAALRRIWGDEFLSTYSLQEAIVLARDTYVQIGSPPPYVSVDRLLRYAESVSNACGSKNHKILVFTAEATKAEYRGFWVRGHNSSSIYVSRELNFCWRRFVVCKEATHILVDDVAERYAKSAPNQAVESFEMVWPTQLHVPLTSEVFAAVVAFELLYPWAHRPRRANPPDPLFDEANRFKIPERYLDTYFKFAYGRLSEQINDGLDGR
jgi:hypothetical protein